MGRKSNMTLSNSTKEDLPELALELSSLTMRASVGMPFIPRNPKGKSGSVKRRGNVAQQRKAMDTVRQLRKEVGLKRLPVSIALRDIVSYVGQQSSQDFL